jgi:large subunit ribosomal protein L18
MLSAQRRIGRERRRARVRKKVWGSDTCPRLCVFRSLKHIYAQVISDETGVTLASASSLSDEFKANQQKAKGIEVAKRVGALLASACKEKNITKVVFDRNGCLYHGRIKALADAVRENGLTF